MSGRVSSWRFLWSGKQLFYNIFLSVLGESSLIVKNCLRRNWQLMKKHWIQSSATLKSVLRLYLSGEFPLYWHTLPRCPSSISHTEETHLFHTHSICKSRSTAIPDFRRAGGMVLQYRSFAPVLIAVMPMTRSRNQKNSSLEVLLYQCVNVSIGKKKNQTPNYMIPKLISFGQKCQLINRKVLRNLLSNMSVFIHSLEEMKLM